MASVVKDEGSGYPIALDSFIPDFSSMSYSSLLTQTVLACMIAYIIFSKFNRKPREVELSEEEKQALIASWEPEPLVPETAPDHPALNPKYVDGKMTKYVQIDGSEYLNIATTNFLGLIGDERIEATAKKTIKKYGVGSCGPRGFYGTVDVHLDLEKELAEFLGCEEAVLYSYGFATIASAIPAYAKNGDVIFVDKGVNFAIQKGVQASRSRVEWFNHNDTDDLERLLEEQAKLDIKDPKKAAKTRRFMVVEGLYYNSGDLCPLPKLLELKWKYKVRIFIDESISFGVLGKTGRGICEHYGVDVIDVDMIMASLENALATTGGFCAGRSFVVGHQRLSGLGYCFSASLPPLLATAASEGLRILNKEPDRFERLHQNARFMRKTLQKVFESTKFVICGDEHSPVQHIYYKDEENYGTELKSDGTMEDFEKKDAREMAGRKLDELVDKMFERGIALTRARYLDKEEAFPIRPSVRLMLQSELNEDELKRIVKTFEEVLATIN